MYKVLEQVNYPDDIKKIKIEDLTYLAQDIRDLLLQSASECGGHLASNLGVVELTIAMHYVYQSPFDKIIWDVGHQSYVHKILTGRKDKMFSLRQYAGLSGFPKIEESNHDSFNTGHSSTSISAALGMALARDIKHEDYSVIAVIGDGALTGGMAFEALNHAGSSKSNLLVILNDNEMSISKNVGAMSSYLNRLRTDPSYYRTKEEIETVLNKIPGIGPNLAKAANRFKDTIKHLLVPGELFEELGFTYIGQINAHNIDELITVLSNAKKMKGPILIHCISEKGRGYEPARKNPDIFHGVDPFDVETGTQIKKPIKTYTDIFGEWIVQEAETNEKIVAITAAMTNGTGLYEFSQQHPNRFFDVGICEQHAVTMAAGMAMQGLRPIVCIYSTFLQRSYDQLIHDVALQKLPVIFAVDRAGLVGEDGPTHHGVFDLSYFRTIPNFTIMAPADEQELVDMFNMAIKINGPVAIRYPRGAGEGVSYKLSSTIEVNYKAVQLNHGDDIAILGIGRGVSIGREVVEILKEKNIGADLYNTRFLKPLDEATINEIANKHKMIVTIEDNTIIGGLGSAVSDYINSKKLKSDVLCMGIPDDFVDHGKIQLLFSDINLDAVSIVENIFNHWPEMVKSHDWELLKLGKG